MYLGPIIQNNRGIKRDANPVIHAGDKLEQCLKYNFSLKRTTQGYMLVWDCIQGRKSLTGKSTHHKLDENVMKYK